MGDFIPDGQHSSSAVENREHESGLYARRVVEIPSNLKMRIAYDSYYREQYIGYAPKGLNTNVQGWLIHKLTYDGAVKRITQRDIATNAVWDNRESETYS